MRLFLFSGLLLLCTSMLCAGDRIRIRQHFFKRISKDPSAAELFLKDKDPEIRRYALYLLVRKDPVRAYPAIAEAANDPDEGVRYVAVSALAELAKKEKRARELLEKVSAAEKVLSIRRIAVRGSWPFHRENRLLREDPSWDYEVKVIKTIPLGKWKWLFTTDPEQKGHLKGFYKKDHDVSSWKPIRMGFWEKQGYDSYNGVAWYQIRFKMPPRMECNAVEIAFGAVDEAAFVWLNGIYLGAHDVGPRGWNEPFALDCRDEILWGEENVLTVRVYDAAFAGGIHKPVRVEVLK